MSRALLAALLRLFTLGFCGVLLAGCASTPVHLTDDTVFSPALKLTITKPPGWRYIDFAEVGKAQKSFRSQNQTLNSLIYGSNYAPLIVMARDSHDGISSNFQPTVAISRYPLGDDRLAPSDRVAGFLIYNYQSLLTGVQVVVYPRPMRIGKWDFAFCRIRFPLAFANGHTYQIEKLFWVKSSAFSAIVIAASFASPDYAAVESDLGQITNSIEIKD